MPVSWEISTKKSMGRFDLVRSPRYDVKRSHCHDYIGHIFPANMMQCLAVIKKLPLEKLIENLST